VRFELSRRADTDISAIYLYGCAEFGMAQADAYTDGLFATIRFLAETPYAARERREFRRPVRCFPFRSHLIVYAVEGDRVLILRILHGHQDTGRHI
jgi:toxin ParE1/3/4